MYKLNEERQTFSELIKSLEHHDLMELKPGPKTRVANMMTIPMLRTVKELQKELRETRPEPIPMTAVTYDMAVQKLCKIDERRDETYWVDDGGAPPSQGDRPKEEQKLSKLEMHARANFARTQARLAHSDNGRGERKGREPLGRTFIRGTIVTQWCEGRRAPRAKTKEDDACLQIPQKGPL